jgi:alanine racemase
LDAILKTVHMLDYSKGHKKAWVHIALDTGFGRTGFTLDALKKDLPAIKEAVEKNRINVRGIYSHFAFDEAKNHPVTKMQTENFKTALSLLEGAGIKPEFVHFANSAAILNDKNLLFDMCRAGVMLYGVSPSSRMGTGYELSLRPAMTCEARIAMVKNMPKGSGISYDHTYVTERDTRTAIVPIGYADGVSRMASSGLADISGDEVLADGSAEYAVGAKTDPKKGAHLLISSRDYDTLTTKRGTGLSTSDSANTRLCQVIGRVCMDQFIVDVPDKFSIKGGGTALLWGDGRGIAYGEPTIEDWARETHTIPYDTMTRFGKSGIPVYYKNWEVLF